MFNKKTTGTFNESCQTADSFNEAFQLEFTAEEARIMVQERKEEMHQGKMDEAEKENYNSIKRLIQTAARKDGKNYVTVEENQLKEVVAIALQQEGFRLAECPNEEVSIHW